MANEQKKGLSTNSNAYTLIYAAVLVIVVAFLLSFISSSLKDRQDANEMLDKKAQILAALNITSEDADADYAKYVKQALVLDKDCNEQSGKDGFEVDFKKLSNEENLPVYVCEVDGATKYVLPLKGNGLWGGIWGYIGLNEDKSTIYGIFFAHESETPGLGAEIVTEKFRKPFEGKHIMNAEGAVVSVAVLKKGLSAEGQEQVDAISGGTITSTGVNDMLRNNMLSYEKFLTK